MTSSNALPIPVPCQVTFTIPNTPKAKFYTLTAGAHSGPAWSEKDLEAQGFTVTLTLGNAVAVQPRSAFCSDAKQVNDFLYRTRFDYGTQWRTERERLQQMVTMLAGDYLAFRAAGDSSSADILADVLPGLYTLSQLNLSFFTSPAETRKLLAPSNSEMPLLLKSQACPMYWAQVDHQ